MDPRCITAVRAAASGRTISDAKLATIEAALDSKMRELARRDPQRWQGLSRDERLQEAVTDAMADIKREAQLKQHRETLQILRTAETDERIKAAATMGNLTRSQGLIRDMEQTSTYVEAVRNESVGRLGDLLDAASNREGAGLLRNLGMRIFDLDNPAMTRDVVREVFRLADGHTGNAAARAGARAWLDTIEAMRVRFNAAGGDVGKLGYGYLAQAHDAEVVRRAGAKQWAADTLPLLDRSQYRRTDGKLMNDGEVMDLLQGAWRTIESGGANKTEPGQFKGSGSRANHGAEARVLHFKDGDAWINYMGKYGEGSLYDSMMGHVGRMARDIGLVERYGPNPEQQFRLQNDIAQRADGAGGLDNRKALATPDSYWDVLSGKATTPENQIIAAIGQNARNVQTAAKLGGAVLSSFTDMATIATTLHFNRLPYFDMLANIGRQMDKDTRTTLRTHGIVGESLIADLNRWTGDHMTHNLTGRVAGSVMKLSLMNAWTDSLRRAFSMTMMGGLERMGRKSWGALDAWDRYLLERKGITEADWQVVQKAQAVEVDGYKMLTPDAIRAVSDADLNAARPEMFQAIRDRVAEQTADLSARNAQEAQWISGRIDAFDAARDGLNRSVKRLRDRKLAKNEAATEPLLQRMALLDAQREQAKLQTDIEAQLNKLVTQDEVRGFLNAVEDGASADLVDTRNARPAVARGLSAAESAGRRYGEAKGRLQRRMQELENKIADMDRQTTKEVDAAAKEAQAKADAMLEDLRQFVKRSQDRQAARIAVIDRLQRDMAPQLAAEGERLRSEVATKLLAFVNDEAQFAVVNPDLATRVAVTAGGLQSGTIKGEAARTFAQFKSFPIAMITRHWRRILETPAGLDGAPLGFASDSKPLNVIATAAALNLSLMLLGALVLQTKALVQGKDPYNMTEGKFWMRANAQGGGAGYLGDLLFKDPTEQHASTTEQTIGTVLGPAAGAVAGLAGDIVVTNAWEAAKGKDTKFAAEALRWGNSQLPYASLWWTRGAYEHWFLHSAQEAVNPGYLARMKARAARDWGQQYYWEPGEALPSRAPDMRKAVGQ